MTTRQLVLSTSVRIFSARAASTSVGRARNSDSHELCSTEATLDSLYGVGGFGRTPEAATAAAPQTVSEKSIVGLLTMHAVLQCSGDVGMPRMTALEESPGLRRFSCVLEVRQKERGCSSLSAALSQSGYCVSLPAHVTVVGSEYAWSLLALRFRRRSQRLDSHLVARPPSFFC